MRTGHVDTITSQVVGGWVADPEDPNRRLEVIISVNGKFVAKCTADLLRRDLAARPSFGDGHHGFRYTFEKELPANETHVIRVAFARANVLVPNGERLLGPASGPAASPPAALPFDRNLSPILVSGAGRSGTTLLMGVLASSPEIIAAQLVPYETRLLAYYANAQKILTHPADSEQSTHQDRLQGDGFSIGFNPYNSPSAHTAFENQIEVYNYFNHFVPQHIDAIFAEIVRAYYRRLAADKRKDGVKFFAEKNNNLQGIVRSFARRAFGQTRELITIRDPRDIFCSQIAWFKIAPERAFHDVSYAVKVTLDACRHGARDVYFSPYERLLNGEKASYLALSEFLQTEVIPGSLESRNAAFKKHATSLNPAASVARWRHELTAEWIERCNVEWRDYLAQFGYSSQ